MRITFTPSYLRRSWADRAPRLVLLGGSGSTVAQQNYETLLANILRQFTSANEASYLTSTDNFTRLLRHRCPTLEELKIVEAAVNQKIDFARIKTTLFLIGVPLLKEIVELQPASTQPQQIIGKELIVWPPRKEEEKVPKSDDRLRGVQGVAFREFCQLLREGLAIQGSAENRDDSSVQVMVRGEEGAINLFIEVLSPNRTNRFFPNGVVPNDWYSGIYIGSVEVENF